MPCKRCGKGLIFSARQSGTGQCGPCQRATRFNLKRWLIKQWHRFTLGRTARHVHNFSGYPGSRASIANGLYDAARLTIPIGVAYEITERRATDLAPREVRIVLETCE